MYCVPFKSFVNYITFSKFIILLSKHVHNLSNCISISHWAVSIDGRDLELPWKRELAQSRIEF